jgi:hypothetical protein
MPTTASHSDTLPSSTQRQRCTNVANKVAAQWGAVAGTSLAVATIATSHLAGASNDVTGTTCAALAATTAQVMINTDAFLVGVKRDETGNISDDLDKVVEAYDARQWLAVSTFASSLLILGGWLLATRILPRRV